MKTYYKVCGIIEGIINEQKWAKYYSAIGTFTLTNLLYEINKWTEPQIKGSNLMVFDSLDKAQDFRIKIGKFYTTIFRCEVKNPSKKGIFLSKNHFIDLLWKITKLKLKKKAYRYLLNNTIGPPEGTIFCSAVKLIEEIKDE